jgi:hypothetical protein
MIDRVGVISVQTRDFDVFTNVAALCSKLWHLKVGPDITL